MATNLAKSYLEPLYTYFKDHNIDDDSSDKRGAQKSDKILNGLCELGLLRTGFDRAFVSLVGQHHEWILAEASSCHCVASDLDPNDKEWLGRRVLPVEQCFCPWTVSKARLQEATRDTVIPKRDALVVPDTLEHPIFSKLALVTENPRVRFYAGVPLIPQKGLCVGSYFILDDKPRPAGISPPMLDQLQDVANLILSHLELMRSQTRLKRAEKMIRGIGTFIDGRTRPSPDLPLYGDQVTERRDRPGLPRQRSASQHTSTEAISSKQQKASRTLDASSSHIITKSDDDDDEDAMRQGRQPAKHDRDASFSISSSAGVLPPPADETDEHKLKVYRLFGEASKTFLESTQFEHVVFLDSRQVTSAASNVKAYDLSSDLSDEDLAQQALDADHIAQQAQPRPPSDIHTTFTRSSSKYEDFPILGAASFGVSSSAETYEALRKSDIRFLRNLIARYPYGKVFQADDDPLSSSGESDELTSYTTLQFLESTQEVTRGQRSRAYQKRRNSDLSRSQQLEALRQYFPGFHSLLFMPLRDSESGRCFATVFASTDQVDREVSAAEDLSYLSVFGSSIMAELVQLETLRADKAKMNFISSISHELRSPLHGVLGSVELLRQPSNDMAQSGLIADIEIAGRTLLHTVDHLLDFSKINNTKTRVNKPHNEPATSSSDLSESNAFFSVIVEEVFQAISAGYEYGSAMALLSEKKTTISSAANPPRPVSLSINVPRAQSTMILIDNGAIRRILTNLCGNAVKYTSAGSVSVEASVSTYKPRRPLSVSGLQQASRDDQPVRPPPQPLAEKGELQPKEQLKEQFKERQRTLVTLKVVDTGRGMSKAFQQDRMFSPFAQEDPYSPGTGLGLSIVKQIVRSMKGSITIDSVKDEGTCVIVRLKLPAGTVDGSFDESDLALLTQIEDHFRDQTFHCFGFALDDPLKESADEEKARRAAALLQASMEHMCQTQFAMKPASFSSADVLITTYSSWQKLAVSGRSMRQPVLVVCRQPVPPLEQLHSTCNVTLSQPVGPLRMARALEIIKNRPPLSEDIIPLPTPLESDFLVNKFEQTLHLQQPRPADAEELEKQTTPARKQIAKAGPSLGEILDDMRVLIVDDNPVNVRLLEMFMIRQKVSYETAVNGQLAFELFKQQADAGRPFGVVLMDISMPVMDGMQATRMIRRFEDTARRAKRSHIVALTGLASGDEQQEIMASGVDLYMSKPVSLKKLKQVIGKFYGLPNSPVVSPGPHSPS